MKEIMYDQSSILIVTALFIGMLITMETGYRIGCHIQKITTETITQANAVLVSMLGLLALLKACLIYSNPLNPPKRILHFPSHPQTHRKRRAGNVRHEAAQTAIYNLPAAGKR